MEKGGQTEEALVLVLAASYLREKKNDEVQIRVFPHLHLVTEHPSFDSVLIGDPLHCPNHQHSHLPNMGPLGHFHLARVRLYRSSRCSTSPPLPFVVHFHF